MKCILVGPNIKIFAKAIQALGKIGSSLFIEPNKNCLILRSINDSKSAFASFVFKEKFFSNYCVKCKDNDGSSYYGGKSRISLKACLGIFKSMKQVEFCKILMDKEKLIVELHCHLFTKKNYVVAILNGEALLSAHNMTDTFSRILGTPKVFGDMANNFHVGEEDMTMVFGLNSLIVKNYEGRSVVRGFMRSKLKLKPSEFTSYSVKEEVAITFSLREFRALLNFAENINLDLEFKFSTAGQPALFTSSIANELEATLLLATLTSKNTSFLNNSNPKDCTKSRSRIQQQQNSCGLAKNYLTDKETCNLTGESPAENELNSFGTCVTFQDSQINSRPIIQPAANKDCKRKARTVFKRCFTTSKDVTCPHTVLAESSDTEQ